MGLYEVDIYKRDGRRETILNLTLEEVVKLVNKKFSKIDILRKKDIIVTSVRHRVNWTLEYIDISTLKR